MADLDDFFAKKDRKKAKNIKKFSTADEIAKKLEDTGKKVEKPIKKDRSNQETDESRLDSHEQDEWKDFEEEKKDYSGLKIGHLSINADGNSGNSGSDNQGGDNSGLGDGGSDSGSTSGDVNNSQNDGNQTKGPWKRVQQHQEPAPVEVAPATVAQTSSTDTKGGYVAPHLRGNRNALNLTQSGGRTRNKAAPDIHNQEYFPTLGSASKPETTNVWGKKSSRNEGTFEEVRHNKASFGRQAAEQRASQGNSQGVKLNLGNRYNTLSTNDS
ncbi:protein CDV3 homolog isoform X1 [Chrysoperla carnea]|uniref:protein CDV3 homolog isoform X1 n=2 Tax=Chrysoperla carnea TaxID=189513 RepID=UPI001D05DABC|nr:protein CDV3 homolog isoform X1 [Chrysoperla carnea]